MPWRHTAEAALALHERLQALGLESFVKTTGGKGLHVVVPIEPVHEWRTVGAFAEALARSMVQDDPQRYLAEASRARRHGRIFVDWLRNKRGATAILPYSTRARPGLPVAVPIPWRDVRTVEPQAFTWKTVPAHLKRRRRDPWDGYLQVKQRIPATFTRRLA